MCTPVDQYDQRICAGAGQAVMSFVEPEVYSQFLKTTGICYFASLTVCFLLVSGVRLEHRLFMWVLSFGMLTVLSTFAYSYVLSVVMLTPNLHSFQRTFRLMGYFIVSWICGLIFIIACHVSSIIFWIVT